MDCLLLIWEGDSFLLDCIVLGFLSGMGIGYSKNNLFMVFLGGEEFGVKY